jgi:hypothetical protein
MLSKEELLEQFDVLATEYIRLLNDKDVLLEWGKPQLEALYSSRIGVFQVELLQLQLQIKSLKRILELARSAINQGEIPDYKAIEESVAEELVLVQIEINLQVDAINEAKQFLSHLASPTRSAELRKIFKILAKQLHPDVNPNLTETQKELWHKVKAAYDQGDVDQLKALQLVYENEIKGSESDRQEMSESEIQLRNEVLKESIKILSEEIKQIRSVFPFDIEDQIKDEEWVFEKVNEIKESIQQHKKLEEELKAEYGQIRQNP